MEKPRIKLLGRKEIRKANPFFLCNLVARRAQQLLDGNVGHSVSQAINIALREFVDGELRVEIANSNGSATATDARAVPAARAEECDRLIETHDEVLTSAGPG
jgi:DNA-directed RNA polymerase subunit K/omega